MDIIVDRHINGLCKKEDDPRSPLRLLYRLVTFHIIHEQGKNQVEELVTKKELKKIINSIN